VWVFFAQEDFLSHADVRFVQPLEQRWLMSTSPTLAEVEAAMTRLASAHDNVAWTQTGGETGVSTQPGIWRFEEVTPPPGAKTPKYKLIFDSPPVVAGESSFPFTPAELNPFPAGYTFLLSASHPTNLFSITEESEDETLTFTGKMSSNLEKITGSLTIVGPDSSVSFTYVVKVR
jgi:hypothetical protein